MGKKSWNGKIGKKWIKCNTRGNRVKPLTGKLASLPLLYLVYVTAHNYEQMISVLHFYAVFSLCFLRSLKMVLTEKYCLNRNNFLSPDNFPLHTAVRKNNYNIIRMLLNAGASVHIVDASGRWIEKTEWTVWKWGTFWKAYKLFVVITRI